MTEKLKRYDRNCVFLRLCEPRCEWLLSCLGRAQYSIVVGDFDIRILFTINRLNCSIYGKLYDRSMIFAESLFLLTQHMACMATVHYI